MKEEYRAVFDQESRSNNKPFLVRRVASRLEKYLQRTNIRVVWILYYTMYQNAARRSPSDHGMTGFHALFGLGLPSGNSIKEITL